MEALPGQLPSQRLETRNSERSQILHQADLLPDDPPWNQFRANRSSQLKLTQMHTRRLFQLVLTSFSFEPEIDLKALGQCFLPLVQDLSDRPHQRHSDPCE
ncbi:MAG: hypothetical protein HC833_18255 [Leptolyngbyaceae cyanobacterium RM1_406_9]|nr:hypothetical protein [Leptolyngbyaceae cyanobacterium SL_5_14]NJO75534.1 hypothetical protein [Leptolyngbyaceae cyanobacterium RM1_406_9]